MPKITEKAVLAPKQRVPKKLKSCTTDTFSQTDRKWFKKITGTFFSFLLKFNKSNKKYFYNNITEQTDLAQGYTRINIIINY